MASVAYTTWEFKALTLSTDFTLSHKLILKTKMHKNKFGPHNGSITQSMPHSENTKIKLIIMMEQRRVLLANPTTTVKQS